MPPTHMDMQDAEVILLQQRPSLFLNKWSDYLEK